MLIAGCTSGTAAPTTAATTPAAATTVAAASPTSSSVTIVAPPSSTPRRPSTSPHSPAPSHPPVPAGVTALPVLGPTGNATQVVTVEAPSTSSTQAVVQAWQRVGGRWQRFGGPVAAWVGSAGLTTHPSETLAATPIGSFTLTQAFGRLANPGTALPYRQTTPADWWISQTPSPLYNTEQHCASNCPFDTSARTVNEHLYYETPFYDYAVVIDYNRAPVVQHAGSAFFLHVTDGSPTAGCVSIDAADLVRIMRWLRPADHPRIVIGLG